MERSTFDWILSSLRYLMSRWPVLIHDVVGITVAWLGAYWFRFNLDSIPDIFLDQAIAMLPVVIGAHIVFFVFFGIHRGAWRFTSTYDLWVVIKAVGVGTVVSAGIIFLLTDLIAVPRSVFPLHGLFLIGFLTGGRITYRLFRDRQLQKGQGKRVMIVGAGAAGDMLLKDIKRSVDINYHVAGFIDDDSSKKGREIQGVRILGECSTIPQLSKLLHIELILIAIPSASAEEMRRLVSLCGEARVPFRTLPKVQDILDGGASSSDLRTVELDDLLGRAPVNLNWEKMFEMIKDQKILITGGAGSIGSELCRQVARLEPKEIILVEQNEFNLYSLGLELEERYPAISFSQLLGDICDEKAINDIFLSHRPQIVFHAAAYKHVPMLQNQIRETMRNNTLGTLSVANAAVAAGVEKFVLISTDKAVNPSSMMGVSKRLAEIVGQLRNDTEKTKFITVRFGNVLGSAGSVVPLFERQIRQGGPVTVTDPSMTRYFMTVSEACQLILQACVMGTGGEIFVLNMGEPVKIDYLARQMIRLAGKVPDDEVEIRYTGLRPGEKLSEELFHPDESLAPTDYEKILLAQARPTTPDKFWKLLEQLASSIEECDHKSVRDVSLELVPEYQSISGSPDLDASNAAA